METTPGSTRQPELVWGPSCDPLRDFELSAQFSKTEYTADLELVPEAAESLRLTAHFSAHCSEWALLTEILQASVRSWVEEEANFVFPMEVDDLNMPIFDGMHSGIRSHKEVDAKLVSDIIIALFATATEMSLQEKSMIQGVTTPCGVPYKSFLWQLALKCLLSASSSDQPEIRSLLRSVWSETIRLLRWHWESCTLVPNVNSPSRPGSKPEVDLRFTLLHQKLAMLNYCIARQSEQATPPKVPSARSELNGSPELLSPPGSFPVIYFKIFPYFII